jgi:surface protein
MAFTSVPSAVYAEGVNAGQGPEVQQAAEGDGSAALAAGSGAAASGEATVSAEAAASGEAATSAEAAASAEAATSGEAATSAEAATSGEAAASEEATTSAEAATSEEAATDEEAATIEAPQRVSAAADTTWQKDYTYVLSKAGAARDTIRLYQYNGSATNIYLPGTAVIDGKTYSTVIGGNYESDPDTGDGYYQSIWCVDDISDIDSLTFGKGVLLAGGEDSAGVFANMMFSNLDLTNVSTMPEDPITSMRDMFAGPLAGKLTMGSSIDTSKVTDAADAFLDCDFSSIDLSGQDFSSLTNMEEMFAKCGAASITMNLNCKNTVDVKRMFYQAHSLQKFSFGGPAVLTASNASELFSGCSSVSSINMSNLDTSKVTDMEDMFYGCSKLASLNLTGHFSTAAAQNFNRMFSGCTVLQNINFDGFTTPSLKSASKMFENCSALEKIDMSKWDVSNVQDYTDIFKTIPGVSVIKTPLNIPDNAKYLLYGSGYGSKTWDWYYADPDTLEFYEDSRNDTSLLYPAFQQTSSYTLKRWKYNTPFAVNIKGDGISDGRVVLKQGASVTLTDDILPAAASLETDAEWSTDDAGVASLTAGSNGTEELSAKSEGTATVTVKLANGVTGTLTVVVSDTSVSPSSVSITGDSVSDGKISVPVGESTTVVLNAQILPQTATVDTGITWSTDNAGIVSLGSTSGAKTRVTIYSDTTGTATITASTANGKTAKLTVTVAEQVGSFTDVNSSQWFYSSVLYVYKRGLFAGTSPTTFSPRENISRGQVASILYRLAGKPAVIYTSKFKDVPDGKYYSAPAMWSSNASVGVLFGSSTSGYYRPLDNITRQEMAAAIYRYAKYRGLDTSVSGDISGYPDVSSVSSWGSAAMKWAVGNGIIAGKKQGSTYYLVPRGNATRAECAAIIKRFCEKYGQ